MKRWMASRTPPGDVCGRCAVRAGLDAEPALDLIQPRGVRGLEVEVECCCASEPAVVLGLVGIEVVQTYVEFPMWVECHQLIHEPQEVPPTTARELDLRRLAGQHVQAANKVVAPWRLYLWLKRSPPCRSGSF